MRPSSLHISSIHQGPCKLWSGFQKPAKTVRSGIVFVLRQISSQTNHPWDLNHWVPCVSADGVSLSDRLNTISRAEDEERYCIDQELQGLDKSDTNFDVVQGSLTNFMELISERSVHLKRLTTRMAALCGKYPVAVPADGNCGPWSLLCFVRMAEGVPGQVILDEDPVAARVVRYGTNEDMMQKMMSIRHRVAEEWRKVAASDAWSPVGPSFHDDGARRRD